MRKNLSILLLFLLLFGCRTAKGVFENNVSESEIKYVYIHNLNQKDSVVFRDSVIIYPDGSKSSFKSKEKYNTVTEKEIVEKIIKKTITITRKILTTKTVYLKDFFWWSGVLSYVLLFIFILIKVNIKFKIL
jgi:hypothetical protein